MSSNSGERTTSRYRVPPSVRVVNWPLRDSGVWGGLAVATWAGVALLAGQVSGSAAMAVVCGAALALACWRFVVPVTFEFGPQGVIQTLWRFRWRIPWRHIARYEVRQSGVLLLADPQPTSLSPLYGVYVRWHGQRNEVLGVIEFFLDRHRRPSVASTKSFSR